MELKEAFCSDRLNMNFCLNRTFYGIESRMEAYIRRGGCVLIVPFMELKVDHDVLVEGVLLVLIVPFMELKDRRQRLEAIPQRRLNRTFYGIES